MRPRRGFTLPELLLGFGIFLTFLGVVFGLFTKGYQAFHFLNTRASVQGEALRLKSVLEADFRMTHFRSVGHEHREVAVDGESKDRDQACCLILDNWQNPANYRDSSGIPLWNRYAVYQTSMDPVGRLERFVVGPIGTVPMRVKPLENLTLLESPRSQQLLSSNLVSFTCHGDVYRQDVEVGFELKETGGQRGLDANSTRETFKAVFRWTPNNTVPRF